jgi:glycosyltransferase involved in cell wall biosynthesis
MNILVFIPKITQEYGGVRQYTYNVLGLFNRDKENSYYVFSNNTDSYPEFTKLIHVRYREERRNLGKRVILKLAGLISDYLITHIMDLEYRIFYQPVIPRGVLKYYCIDAVYCPIQLLPKGKFKKIMTIHDLQELHFPAFFSPDSRKYRAINNEKYISEADMLITSYEHIKSDVTKFFNISAENIFVIPHSFTNNWFEKYAGSATSQVRIKYNLPGLFFLYPAATWEHKNHLQLLRSFVFIRSEFGLTISLVCTGDRTEYYSKELEPFIVANNLGDDVFFTGIIDEFDLYSMYSETNGVIIPSLYEAGSFPLYESILLGVPVICSDTTSLPDTIGDSRFVFDPLSIHDMANKICSLFSDEEYRKENIRNSQIRASQIRGTDSMPVLQNMIHKLEANGKEIEHKPRV